MSTLLLLAAIVIGQGGADAALPDLSNAEPQVAAAITEAYELVLAEPDSAQRWGRYASLLHVHAFAGPAAGAYETAARLEHGEFRWPYLLAILLEPEDPVASLEKLEEALRRNDRYAPLHVRYGQILQRMGRTAAAMEAFRQASRLDDRNAFAHAGLGQCLIDAGQAEQAKRHLDRAVKLDPECRRALSALAAYHRLAVEMDLANYYAGRAARATERSAPDELLSEVRLMSVGTTAVLRRVHVLNEAGRTGEALRRLRKLLEDNPDSVRGRNKLGDLLLEQGGAQEALEQFDAALSVAPDFVSARVGRAQALARLNRLEEARALYEAVIDEHPSSVRAYTGLGACLAEQGSIDLAVERMRQALELAPEDTRSRVGFGWALYYSEDYEGALATLMPVVAEAGDSPDTITVEAIGHAGLALLMLDRPDKAIPLLKRAVIAAPTRADLRRGLAVAFHRSGRDKDAADTLRRGLLLDSRDGAMALQLVTLLATSPHDEVRDGARAVQLAERLAEATQRRNPEVLGGLACAYAETQRYREAAETAAQAVELATAEGLPDLVDTLRAQLATFQAGQAWREEAMSHEP